MSSPIHRSDKFDDDSGIPEPPPRLTRAGPEGVVTRLSKRQPRNVSLVDASRAFSGDRAMLELQRRLALNPNKVPMPPLEQTSTVWLRMMRLSVIIGIAGLVAWGAVSLAMHNGGDIPASSDNSPTPGAAKQVKLLDIRPVPSVPPALVGNEVVAATPPPVTAASPMSPTSDRLDLAPDPNFASAPASDTSTPTTRSAIASAASLPNPGSSPGTSAPNSLTKSALAPAASDPNAKLNSGAPNPLTKSVLVAATASSPDAGPSSGMSTPDSSAKSALVPAPSDPNPGSDSSAPNLLTKSPLAPAASDPASGSEQTFGAPVPAASISAPAVPGNGTVRLAVEEIALLVKRGKDFFNTGDLISARLLLQRAAEAGSAEAALVLGSTFDPLVIRQLGVLGIQTDIARAQQWYVRAAALGSADASQRLKNLQQAH
jgi:hypothetical protein